MYGSIVSFGEIMLRLSPLTTHERLEKTHALKMDFAGAESNVAVALAILGHSSYFVTCLPPNAVGNAAINSLRQFGVDTHYIHRSGKRVGTYFIEYGASIRPTQVTYDREFSAISQINQGDIHWEEVLAGKDWLNLTGITPALSENCARECLLAVQTAKKLGVQVAFDLNFRRTLWSQEAARKEFTQILPYVDVLFANIGSLYDIFAIDTGNPQNWQEHLEATRQAAKAISRLCQVKLIGLTVRDHPSASENYWAGLLYDNERFYESRQYHFHLVERLGGGDAFCAGVLHGLCKEWSLQETVEFASAASALKHTIPGDLNLASESEILEVAQGNVSGQIKR